MLHTVDIRCERETLAKVMSAIREWLDAQHFEPDAFRCQIEEDTVICNVGFKSERKARACAQAFDGQLSSPDASSS